MKINYVLLPALVVSFVGHAGVARADRRAFTHTYEYMTIPEGDLELEFYNTESRDRFARSSPREFEQQIEIEYGITAHWDISLYQVFNQGTNPDDPSLSSPFGYNKTKVKTRYRFGERGASVVDTLIYVELQKKFGKDEYAFEPKLVLARDFGKVTAALNLIPEIEIEEEVDTVSGDRKSEVVFAPQWAVGITYEYSPKLKLGGEWFGEWGSPGDENEISTSVGPSVSWAPSRKLWAALNAGFGLTDDSADFTTRFIIGLGL